MADDKRLTLGPGLLTIGSAGSLVDLSGKVTEVSIEWKADAEDSEYVLSGDAYGGDVKYTATLKGSGFQTLEYNDWLDFSWKNAGKELPFTFIPDKAGTSLVEGKVRVDPITLGGKVRSKNKSDFEWSCIGIPTLDTKSTKVATLVKPGGAGA